MNSLYRNYHGGIGVVPMDLDDLHPGSSIIIIIKSTISEFLWLSTHFN